MNKDKTLKIILKVLEKQGGVAAEKAARNIAEYYGQNKILSDSLRRKVIIDDLVEDVQRGVYDGKKLPFEFTDQSLYREYDKFFSPASRRFRRS